MNAADSAWLARFSSDVVTASEAELRSDITLGGKLLLGREGRLEVCYAPFEHLGRTARVVLLGITPGRHQATNALLEVRRQIISGADHWTALAAAKSFASFSGPLRSNLVAMLDFIGLNSWLGLQSCATLWLGDNDLVHFTSALRFPVFVDGQNYSGQPSITSTPLLRKFLAECLSEEASMLCHAVWVPLGPQATLAADWLVERGCLQPGCSSRACRTQAVRTPSALHTSWNGSPASFFRRRPMPQRWTRSAVSSGQRLPH